MIEFFLIGLILVIIALNTEIAAYYKAGRNAIIKPSWLIGTITVLLLLVLAALIIYFIAAGLPFSAILALIVELVILYLISPS
jgi:hypothetical protein